MLMVGTTSLASAQPQLEVVATGLDSPRHVTFSATGDLYVAEAGRGVRHRVSITRSGSSASGLLEP
jgi:hypothetical protein